MAPGRRAGVVVPLVLLLTLASLGVGFVTARTSPSAPGSPAPGAGTPGSPAPALSAASPAPIGGRLFTSQTTLPDGATNSVSGLVVDPARGMVFSANRYAGTLTEFNESTGAVVTSVAVAEFAAGTAPTGLALDAVGHRLFVPISTLGAPTGGGPGGWLLVLNETTLAVEANVSFPGAPLGTFEPTYLAYDAPSDQVFVENASAGELAAVNARTYTVAAYLPCPVALCAMHGYGLLDIPSFHTLLLPTCQPELWLVNTSNDSTRAVVTGPPDTIMAWSAFDSVDQILWVENYTYYGTTGSFLRYNLSTLTLEANIPDAPPRGSAIAYDPVDNLLLATDLNGSEQISVYDASNASLLAAYASTGSGIHPFTSVADDPVTHLVIAAGAGNGSTVAFHLPTLDLARTYTSFSFRQTATAVGAGVPGVAYVAGIDPATLRAIAEANGTREWETPLPAGATASAIAADPTTETLYVVDSATATVWEYGAASGGYLGAVALGNGTGPCAAAVDPAHRTLYVGETFPPAVVTVNLSSQRVVATVDLPGATPCRLSLDPVTGDLLVLSTGSTGTLWSVGVPSLTVTATWTVGPDAIDLAVSPNGTVYVLDGGGAHVTVLNGTSGAATGGYPLPGAPASGIALDPVDGLLFATGLAGPTVAVLNASDGGRAGALTTLGATTRPSFDGVAETLVAPLTYAGGVFLATAVPVPGAPQGLAVVAGNTSANLSWSPPVSSGPYAVDGYQVALVPAGAGAHLVNFTTALRLSVGGLVDGVPYSLTVAATSAAGVGTTPAVGTVTPVGVPYPPTHITATATGSSSVAVTWGPPASDDGSPVTGYAVWVVRPGGGPTVEVGPGTNSTTITGLSPATNYSLYVTALNAVGGSHPSRTVATTTPAAPPAPTPIVTYAVLAAVLVAVALFAIWWRPRRSRPAPNAAPPDPPGRPVASGREPRAPGDPPLAP